MNLESLHSAIASVAPIDGVSPEGDDRSMWTIWFRPEATKEQIQAARAAVLSWIDGPLPKIVTFDQWLALFTSDERAWAFSSNDPNVREMIARGSASNMIDLSSPTVAAFCDLAIALGSPLTVERKADVLAGMQQEASK